MATIVKDLGAVTAYAYAKEKGYTGTEDEFAELMASYADVAEQAAESAAQAGASATAAEQAKAEAVLSASAAASSASTASTKASEAASSASSAAGSANTATTKANEASTSATNAASSASAAATSATNAGASATAAASSATAASNAQTAAETAQGKAEDAQTAAEDAAASVSASAAQITQNTEDVADLKSALDENFHIAYTESPGYISINGTISAQSETNLEVYTSLIPFVYGQTIDFKLVKPNASLAHWIACGLYDENQAFIERITIENGTLAAPIECTIETTNKNCRYISITYRSYGSVADIDFIKTTNSVNKSLAAALKLEKVSEDVDILNIKSADLKSAFDEVENDLIESNINLMYGKIFVRKTIDSTNGAQFGSTIRISLEDKLYCGNGTVTVKGNGLKTWWYEYDKTTGDKTNAATEWQTADYVLIVSENKLYNFVIAKTDDSEILPSENTVTIEKDIGSETKIPNDILLNKYQMTSGALQTASVTTAPAINWLSYLVKVPINGGDTATITLPSISDVVWHYRYGWYYASDASWKGQNPNTTNNTVNIPADCGYFSFAFFACDSNGNQLTNLNLADAFPADGVIKVSFAKERTSNFAIEKSIIDYINNTFELKNRNTVIGYSVGADMIKRGITAKFIGKLTARQSFCVYNGKYYSTDGTEIIEQNIDFTVNRRATLSLGHGNTLQIGNSNRAYVSGWNDHKLYVVNLDTLTVSDTISLPFESGYEDIVVDDINNLAYILHRQDVSDTAVAPFDFIVYDLSTNQIKSQKKTTSSFGLMQSADFYNGKIIVFSGGNDASGVPARAFVFNTVGDTIAELSIPIFAGDEPEGICFDRDNKYLLVSGYNRSVYKIEQF